jgi:peptide deformylase
VKVGQADILQLGHPALRVMSERTDVDDPGFHDDAHRLLETLEAFRQRFGFGRAIAAPQIGVARRLIAMNLGDGPFLILNPEITWRSAETFTMWDDCMSFPGLLVRLKRDRTLSVTFTDELGQQRNWPELDQAMSELLQHEIDHLDGILAIDRAESVRDVISRESFERLRPEFDRQVDYAIGAANDLESGRR